MATPSETGRFWICPECKRHVPTRKDACHCGFDRTQVPVRMREVSAQATSSAQPERSFIAGAWPFIAIALLVGYIAYDRSSRSEPPKPAPPSAPPAEDRPTPPPFVLSIPEAQAPTRDVAQGRPVPEMYQQQHPQTIRIEVPQGQAPQPVLQQQPVVIAAPEPVDPMKTEGYWRQRFYQSRDRVRSANENCLSYFHQGGGNIGQTNYAGATAALSAAIAGQFLLEEEARRAGVPPGWVRFDWSVYPSLQLPDPTSLTGTLKVRHPCSVPELLKETRY